jgi:hypothetical protein
MSTSNPYNWVQIAPNAPGITEFQMTLVSANDPSHPTYYDSILTPIATGFDPTVTTIDTQFTPGMACYIQNGPCVSFDPASFTALKVVFANPVDMWKVFGTGGYVADGTGGNGLTSSILITGAPSGDITGVEYSYTQAPEPSVLPLLLLGLIFLSGTLMRGRRPGSCTGSKER